MTQKIVFNIIQVLVVMIFSPLIKGIIDRFKERVQSRKGPGIFQPYRDIRKLFHKDEVISEESSWERLCNLDNCGCLSPDPHLLDRLLGRPIILSGRYLANRLGRMHSGRVNAYAAYVLTALLLVLLLQVLV